MASVFRGALVRGNLSRSIPYLNHPAIPGSASRQRSFMPLDQNLTRRSFDKLKGQLAKISSKLAPEDVHRFRTYARRVEVLLDPVLPEVTRNEKKLVKLLARSRKKAGRVRDLDMQISLLGTLKVPQAGGQKAQLLRALIEKRERSEKKLRKALDRKTIAEMRRRLRKTAARVEIPLAV